MNGGNRYSETDKGMDRKDEKNAGRGTYRTLNVYQSAHELVKEVYIVTRKYPRDEIFGLTSQMRRSAVSVAANIVEGYGRRTTKDRASFLYIARGSLVETEYYIDLSLELGYISDNEHRQLMEKKHETGKLLFGFLRSLTKE